MRQIILNFSQQFPIGIKRAQGVKAPGRFDEVLICGMGGSALAADVLKMWLEAYKIGLPLSIQRDYGLPGEINPHSLIICISYSGNTEETLSSFNQARRKNLPLIAITSGGRLAELCQRHKIPFAKIPSGYQPRLALGFQFSALMQILVNCRLIENGLENVLALEKKIKSANLEGQGKKLAKKLKSKIPLIYSSRQRKTLARIWKINFNENSKIPAFFNYFPELNHNEMEGFENPQGKFHGILLRDPADHPRNLKRMKLTAEILKKRGIPIDFIEIEGKDILYKIFNNLLLANWASYYLALEYGLDPVPVKLVEEFKAGMAEKKTR